MTDKGKTLKKKLKSGIVTFIYRKKSTGETRRAVGTTNIALIPKEKRLKPYKERTRRAPSDSIVYYDLDKEDVRSLKDRFLQRVVKTVLKDDALEDKEEKQQSTKDEEQQSQNSSKKAAKSKFISRKTSSKQADSSNKA